jgi:hypothetical protein
MYSPKINEDLIPKLYALAKSENKPMTEVVNLILSDALKQTEIAVPAAQTKGGENHEQNSRTLKENAEVAGNVQHS